MEEKVTKLCGIRARLGFNLTKISKYIVPAVRSLLHRASENCVHRIPPTGEVDHNCFFHGSFDLNKIGYLGVQC